jgi:hypothetical protein
VAAARRRGKRQSSRLRPPTLTICRKCEVGGTASRCGSGTRSYSHGRGSSPFRQPCDVGAGGGPGRSAHPRCRSSWAPDSAPTPGSPPAPGSRRRYSWPPQHPRLGTGTTRPARARHGRPHRRARRAARRGPTGRSGHEHRRLSYSGPLTWTLWPRVTNPADFRGCRDRSNTRIFATAKTLVMPAPSPWASSPPAV